MANRLERSGQNRERQRIMAQMREMFLAQEMATVGKKKTNRFGRPKAEWGLGVSAPSQGGINPNLASNTLFGTNQPVYGQGMGFGSYQPQQQGRFGGGQQGNFWQSMANLGRGALNTGLGGVAFMGPGYDIWRGMQPAEQFNEEDYFNPQYQQSLAGYNKGLNLLANRRYDPSAELTDIERQSAIFRQGLRNTGNIGAGALRQHLAGANVREQQARGQILTKKQNIDLGMKGEEAQGQFQAAEGRGRLGAQRAATRFTLADYNARNRAQRQNLLSAGLYGMGEGAQNLQLMRNMRLRDQMLLPALQSYGGGMYNYGPQGIQFGGQGYNQQQWDQQVRGFGPMFNFRQNR